MRVVFAIVDGAAILLICYLSLRAGSVDRFQVLLAAGTLFLWQGLENGLLRRRYGVPNLPDYPAGIVWSIAALAAVLVTSLLERWLTGATASSLAGAIGLGLCAAGVALRLAAFGSIGTDFLRPPWETQELVKAGPYRFLKHPAGWGLFAIGLGAALAWGSKWGVAAACLLLLPSLLYAHAAEAHARRERPGAAVLHPTFSQRFSAHPFTPYLYENLIHPLFLVCFTRYFRFETIYVELRKLAGGEAGPRGRMALDAACGSGWFGRRLLREPLSEAATHVVGIDISESMLQQARRLADEQGVSSERLSLRCADAHDLKTLAPQSFDEVWLCGALHQIPDPARTLAEVAGVTRPGGLLFCQTFVESQRRLLRSVYRVAAAPAGFTFFKRAELLDHLADAGYTLRGETTSGCVILFCAEKNGG